MTGHSSAGNSSPWTPGPRLINWQPADDDASLAPSEAHDFEEWAAYLLAASPEAFAELEGEFAGLISLCHTVAPALRKAETVEWYGDARDKFSHAVGHFPRLLDTIASSLQTALNALTVYCDATFTQQALYIKAVGDVTSLTTQYQKAVHPDKPYASEHEGMTLITGLQHQLTGAYTDAQGILRETQSHLLVAVTAFSAVKQEVPHAGIFAGLGNFVADSVEDLGKTIANTVPAFLAYLNHPDEKNLEDLTGDLATDAGALATVATLGAASPLVAGLDAGLDTSLALGFSEAGEYLSGVALNASILAAGDDFAQGKIGDGLVGVVFAAFGDDASDDGESAVNQVRALNDYNKLLAKGEDFSKLSAADQSVLKDLFPDGDYASAATTLSTELEKKLKGATSAAGIESLEDFIKDTFVTDPAQKVLTGG